MTISCPNTEPYCKCINWKDEDFDVEVDHLIHNFEFLRLEMTYSVLDETSPIRMCEIGRCLKCGGRICIGATESHAEPVSKRLEWLYFIAFERLRQHRLSEPVTPEVFQALFPALFHENDQPFVRDWLACPETQSYVLSLLGGGKEAAK